jgi:diacylglycerol kinase family enzyme
MHVYIYDSFLNKKRYDNTLARVETRLTDLGLNGKIARLGPMKNIKSIVENELKRGAKTIVAVGNDQTVSQVINTMAGAEQIKMPKNSAPLGIIPIGKNNYISSSLGIELEELSCDILAARRIEKVDLCLANNNFFISNATIPSEGTILEINKTYSIEITGEGEISIINMPTYNKPLPSSAKYSPSDGIFELFIKTKTKGGFFKINAGKVGESIFSLKRLTIINSNNYPAILDDVLEVATPVEISILKQKLNVIVGKERSF